MRLQGQRVLICEDEPYFAIHLAKAVEDEGGRHAGRRGAARSGFSGSRSDGWEHPNRTEKRRPEIPALAKPIQPDRIVERLADLVEERQDRR
jgi:hypothetical protein